MSTDACQRNSSRSLSGAKSFFRPLLTFGFAVLAAGAVGCGPRNVFEPPPEVVEDATVYRAFPGADAKTVGGTIGAPIEADVNGGENMLYMQSVNGNDGTCILTITFESGTNLDMANVLVQNRISAAVSKLPQETQRQGVRVKKRSIEANLYAVIYSPDERFDGLFLSNCLTLNIQDEIARSPGVGEVSTFGVGNYSMRAWLDPEMMQVQQLTPGDVMTAIRDHNDQVATAERSLEQVYTLYENGLVQFLNVLDAQCSLVQQQDQLARSRGQIYRGMVQLHRALGHRWEPEPEAG